MNKKIQISAAAVIIISAAFYLAYLLLYKNNIKTVKPKIGTVVEAVYALGTVKSDNTYNLRLMANTVLKKKYVSEGEYVRSNSPLIMTDYGLVFTAPFSGTVTRLYFEEGETITPAAPVLTIIDLAHAHVLVSLDQQSALRIRKNQNVELSFESIRNKKFKGSVDRIYPSNGQFLVKIRPESLPAEVLPEMTADTAIEIERRGGALLVPLAAVKRGMVEFERNGQKKKIKVSPGALSGEWVEIPNGQILPDDIIYYEVK